MQSKIQVPLSRLIALTFVLVNCSGERKDGLFQSRNSKDNKINSLDSASDSSSASNQNKGDVVINSEPPLAVEEPKNPKPTNEDITAKDNKSGTAGSNIPTIDKKTIFAAVSDEDALHGLKTGEEQMAVVCARNSTKVNKVITTFCTNKVRPKSLVELQTALGVGFPATTTPGRGNNGAAGNGPRFAIQGHSSSLVGRFVSSINPRVILLDPSNNADLALGFVRGEQLSEIAVKNADGTFDFFIAAFGQACNKAVGGCTVGDLLTPAVEKDWTSFTIYQDDDLKNTIVDCLQCHQPNGPGTPKLLRMQELVNPWTHWFRDNTAGRALITEYQAAHGTTETYGGVPGSMIGSSDPALLEDFVRDNGFVDPNISTTNGGDSQPNQFDTAGIATQMAATNRTAVTFFGGAACGVSQTVNSPSKSTIWDGLLFNFMNRTNACLLTNQVAGTVTVQKNLAFIPPPYNGLRVTDPTALATFTKQYQDFNAGTVTAKTFKDHREVLLKDQKELAQAGFAVDPSMSPADTLKIACSQCHSSQLDSSISRSKFNAVDLDKMANRNEEIDIAIARVKLGLSPERLKAEGMKIINEKGEAVEMHKAENVLTMPPRRFRVLTDSQIDALVIHLNTLKK